MVRAATREQTRCGRRARQAPPVTVVVLQAMIDVLGLLSFLFGTAILAITINLVASLTSK